VSACVCVYANRLASVLTGVSRAACIDGACVVSRAINAARQRRIAVSARSVQRAIARLGALRGCAAAQLLQVQVGKKLPGHMGWEWRSHRGVRIVRINHRHQVIYVHSNGVPGEVNQVLLMSDSWCTGKHIQVTLVGWLLILVVNGGVVCRTRRSRHTLHNRTNHWRNNSMKSCISLR
jgi:hypothetical protein